MKFNVFIQTSFGVVKIGLKVFSLMFVLSLCIPDLNIFNGGSSKTLAKLDSLIN